MSEKKANKAFEEGNIYNYHKPLKNFTMFCNALLDDDRLGEDKTSYYLITQLIRKDHFHISLRRSCRAFHMSQKSFQKYLNKLISYGYLKRIRTKNGFFYQIPSVEQMELLRFDYREFRDGKYSNADLKAFLKSECLEERWRVIIKDYLASIEKQISKANKDIEKEAKKDDNLPF